MHQERDGESCEHRRGSNHDGPRPEKQRCADRLDGREEKQSVPSAVNGMKRGAQALDEDHDSESSVEGGERPVKA